ncbi:hypothetical protein IEE84_04260 [Psychrobacter sp. 28M-43]|uniref:hypothetical protein n=1 Tax=Psychrobacter sp. 28M-43 TaxID=2772254 RepID=UPI00168CB6E3|nr:hypothetical protein [Psychrobacter sp. 28M-43]QOD13499.1 hypothetical protein IEE84_04260 [Psychrobacter sp. 28M-43]
MALYSITYDLVKKKDYDRIYEGIKTCGTGAYARPTESQWIVKSNKSAREIVDHLRNFTDSDDKIFVIPVNGKLWASFNVSQKIRDWLGKYS